MLGEEIGEEGLSSIKIDDSEIIVQNTIFWMFVFIERTTKNARVFYVLTDRTKLSLLPIVKQNV